MKYLLFIFLFLTSNKSLFAETGIVIYYIQSVTYYYSTDEVLINKADYSLFLTLKECEEELLYAASNPDSNVARENDLSVRDNIIKRKKNSDKLIIINEIEGYILVTAQCTSKYISPEGYRTIEKDWKYFNRK